MIRTVIVAFAVSVLAACTQPAPAAQSAAQSAAVVDPGARIAHGKYLAESIGMCGDCHTLRKPDGQLDMTRHLHGAALPFAATHPQPWAPNSPAIAGLPKGYTEAQLASFLQDGKRPDGSTPLPPMPAFRFDQEDAEAVAAYLASLPKPPEQ